MEEALLREVFADMVVLKDPQRSEYFSSMNISSYMRDWIVMKFSDDDGDVDYDSVRSYIKRYIPSKDDFEKYKFQMINGDSIQFLARVRATVDVKAGNTKFELPDFGGLKNGAGGIIDNSIAGKWKNSILTRGENWGIITLEWGLEGNSKNPKGVLRMIAYEPFCPYEVDLDYYRDAREEFTLSQWLDVLLGAMDYNADGYENEAEKLSMLTRLLPFVERKVNLIELAPKGTGKSYVFGHVSKHGMLVDGGKVTRASLFYHKGKKEDGYIVGHDYVAIDEVKLVQFDDINQMRSAFQGYMEYGSVTVDGYEVVSDAGMVFLGNIDQNNMNVEKNMFSELPTLFKESALVDRIHGFVKGWEIPRMNDDMKIHGWALNSEYFSSILHELRDDMTYRNIVDNLIVIPEKADTRDTEAVRRLATAYLKLLFPNVRRVEDVNPERFGKYCLKPAMEMRGIIIRLLGILDEQFAGESIS